MAKQPQPRMPAGFVIGLALDGAGFALVDGLLSHGAVKIMGFGSAAALVFVAVYTWFWIRRMRRIMNQRPPAPWAAKMRDTTQKMMDGTQH